MTGRQVLAPSTSSEERGLLRDIRSALQLLGRRDTAILGLVVAAQALLSILDLVGVLVLGLVAAIGMTAVQGDMGAAAGSGSAWLERFGLDARPSGNLIIQLALLAAAALLVKSIASAALTRWLLVFLARRQAVIADELTDKLLNASLVDIQARSSQEVAYALGPGLNLATVVLLGQGVLAFSEAILLGVLAVVLFVLNPVVAAASVAYFVGVGLLMQASLGRWSADLGGMAAKTDVSLTRAIQEVMEAFREVSVSGRRGFYRLRIGALRQHAASIAGKAQFIGQIPKYVLEAALVVGTALLATYGLLADDKVGAASTLVVFLVAGARMMPSLMRMQGAILQVREVAGRATPTFDLLSFLMSMPSTSVPGVDRAGPGFAHPTWSRRTGPSIAPDVLVQGVTFTYPNTQVPALCDVSLFVAAGSSLAIVGRSGAGKSSVADLIMGLLEPDSGIVSIGGLPPSTALEQWPGFVSYVPQHVTLANGSVAENVALGLPERDVDEDRVWEALIRAHLGDFVKALPDGLGTEVGERGTRLSGGQRQRIGLARAFYTRPSILVMDEATSALDAETEQIITHSLSELAGHVTTITIAHRLATIREADQVAYLDKGRIEGTGTFEEVRLRIPDLDRQARLLGL